MKKNKISKNWVNKQKRDIYVRQSKIDGYRARSVYKLIEIDKKFKIFKGGINVVDIGAAPGSWSQYASKIVKNGKIISIDLKEMGYDKLLGTGVPSQAYKITISAASAKAVEKVEAAGGEIING